MCPTCLPACLPVFLEWNGSALIHLARIFLPNILSRRCRRIELSRLKQVSLYFYGVASPLFSLLHEAMKIPSGLSAFLFRFALAMQGAGRRASERVNDLLSLISQIPSIRPARRGFLFPPSFLPSFRVTF